MDRLGFAKTAHYRSTVSYGSEAVEETGSYNLGNQRYETTKSARSPEGEAFTLRVRRLTNGDTYIQRVQGSEAPSCWAHSTAEGLSEFSAENTGQPATQSPVPGAILGLMSVETDGATRSGKQVRAEVDAYLGLVQLGVSNRTMFPLEKELEGHLVPVVVELDSERDDAEIVGATVSGRAVLAALGREGVELDRTMEQGLELVETRLELSSIGEPVTIAPPLPDEVVPIGADWASCTLR